MIQMSRKPKPLIEKSTAILFRLDNNTLFKFCDLHQIEYDKDASYVEPETKKEVNSQIKKIIENLAK